MKRKMLQLEALAMGTLKKNALFANTEEASGEGFEFLNGTLDDIEDLPQFAVFRSGAYVVNFPEGLVNKKIKGKNGEKPAVELKCVCKEVKELSNPEDAEKAPKAGDIGGFLFMVDNETGRGFLKMVLKAYGDKLGTKDVQQCKAAVKGTDALVIVKWSEDKSAGREYMNLVKISPI
jgi:hypothetical protein